MSIVIASLFITALLSVNPLLVSASTPPSQSPSTMTEQQQQQQQPKPGIIMIITFENGTTKAIRSDSTNIMTVQGGYFISDPSVSAAKPLQTKTISKTVVQQLVTMFVDVKIEEDRVISSEGCGEGYGYYADDPSPICEPLDSIGQGPPPDQAFCAALGCPYNPPNPHQQPPSDPGPPLATTPVEPPGPGELSAAECAAIQCDPENPVQPEPAPDLGNEDQNEEGQDDTQNSEEDGGDGDNGGGAEGNGGSEGDDSSGDEGEEG